MTKKSYNNSVDLKKPADQDPHCFTVLHTTCELMIINQIVENQTLAYIEDLT